MLSISFFFKSTKSLFPLKYNAYLSSPAMTFITFLHITNFSKFLKYVNEALNTDIFKNKKHLEKLFIPRYEIKK